MQNISCVIFTNLLCGHLCQTMTVKPQNVSFSSSFVLTFSTFNCHSTPFALRFVIKTSKCWFSIFYCHFLLLISQIANEMWNLNRFHDLYSSCLSYVNISFVAFVYFWANSTLYPRWSSVTVVAISRLSLIRHAGSKRAGCVGCRVFAYTVYGNICNWCGVRGACSSALTTVLKWRLHFCGLWSLHSASCNRAARQSGVYSNLKLFEPLSLGVG